MHVPVGREAAGVDDDQVRHEGVQVLLRHLVRVRVRVRVGVGVRSSLATW